MKDYRLRLFVDGSWKLLCQGVLIEHGKRWNRTNATHLHTLISARSNPDTVVFQQQISDNDTTAFLKRMSAL